MFYTMSFWVTSQNCFPRLMYKVNSINKVNFPNSWPLFALTCNSATSLNPVTLLHSLLDQYPKERYKSPYPPNYELNSTTTILLQG